MTARDRLVALQRVLAMALLGRAALVGAAVAAIAIALGGAFALPATLRLIGFLAAASVAVALALRTRALRSLERVALWVEEQHPELRYAVVTAAGGGGTAALERQASAVPWWDDATRRAWRSLLMPAAILVAAMVLAIRHPTFVSRDALSRRAERSAARSAVTDPLASVRVTITPPSYTGRRSSSLDNPTSIEGLAGSAIAVEGDGDATSVRAALDSTLAPVSGNSDRWRLRFIMPSRPMLLHLRAEQGRERLVVLAPALDAAPSVTLLLPARDTVVRAATGTIVLRAGLRDDIGLRDASFELIVSSGQEENFTFRTTTIGRRQLSGSADASMETRLSLDSLALKPGDVLQLRAVARDASNLPSGFGSSETRALRVARAGEYDSVAVEAAAPGEPEGQVLSQRMLITLTEALAKHRSALTRPALLDESRRIATDQARLRKRVGDIVFQRTGNEPLGEESTVEQPSGKITPEELLAKAREATGAAAGAVMDVEGDETPILAVNKPLLEAFNAMWDAGRALEQGEPTTALPPMRRALAAIERARQAERIYLRGRPAAVIVDVAHARLAGKDKGANTVREPRLVTDPVNRRRADAFAHATELLARNPGAAADTLLVMRVDALGNAPVLAAALDDAARALRRGDRDRIPLAWAAVRRALGSDRVAIDSLPAWGGAP